MHEQLRSEPRAQNLPVRPLERRPRIALGVELRKTVAGEFRHPSMTDHYISVHAGAPVRVSCHSSSVRSVRTRGEMNLMPAGSSEIWMEDDDSSSVELRVPQSLLRLVAEDMGLDPARAGIEPRFHFRDTQMEHIAWALEADRRKGFPNGLLYSESLGMALAVHLLGQYRAPVEIRGGLSQMQVARVADYVEANLDKKLSLATLARVAGVSASHFKTLFKRSIGVPVHEYVIQRRVERAKSLLLRGDLPASQIVLEAGFSHQSHMARCMRRVLGVTPTALVRSRAVA
ncbi:helix-turn-helix domain-containing protein [Pendulispora albinea]|uniref:AraC family transcriptional regulator n=1 Tax=Pendulispora albinea TaxID=2741071 RepID=A0ABZ2LYW6_9BACT